MKKLQIFVSSTFTDLREERQAAVEAILKSGDIPAGMELFTPGDESQMQVIREWIDNSDGYVLILGSRYGSVESKSGKSYVELEYEYAGERSKPRFAIVIADDRIAEIQKANPADARLERDNHVKYGVFRLSILQNKVCEIFRDAKDIKLAIQHTLAKWKENPTKFVGWIRGSDVDQPRKELLNASMQLEAGLKSRSIELEERLKEATVKLLEFEKRSDQAVKFEKAYREAQATLDKLASARNTADVLTKVWIPYKWHLGTSFLNSPNSLAYVFKRAGDRFIHGFYKDEDRNAIALDKHAGTKLRLYGVAELKDRLWKATDFGVEVLKVLNTWPV